MTLTQSLSTLRYLTESNTLSNYFVKTEYGFISLSIFKFNYKTMTVYAELPESFTVLLTEDEKQELSVDKLILTRYNRICLISKGRVMPIMDELYVKNATDYKLVDTVIPVHNFEPISHKDISSLLSSYYIQQISEKLESFNEIKTQPVSMVSEAYKKIQNKYLYSTRLSESESQDYAGLTLYIKGYKSGVPSINEIYKLIGSNKCPSWLKTMYEIALDKNTIIGNKVQTELILMQLRESLIESDKGSFESESDNPFTIVVA